MIRDQSFMIQLYSFFFNFYYLVNIMNKFVSFMILALSAFPVFARDQGTVPEPETLALMAIGMVGLFISSAKKK